MKRENVDEFEKLKTQLDSIHQEMSQLAKKSPNDAVNTFKIKFVNVTLKRCNDLLGPKYRPYPDFDAFSADDLPSNSDVTFIVSQYIESAEKFRSDHIFMQHGQWWWSTDDVDRNKTLDTDLAIRTMAPKKLRSE